MKADDIRIMKNNKIFRNQKSQMKRLLDLKTDHLPSTLKTESQTNVAIAKSSSDKTNNQVKFGPNLNLFELELKKIMFQIKKPHECKGNNEALNHNLVLIVKLFTLLLK